MDTSMPYKREQVEVLRHPKADPKIPYGPAIVGTTRVESSDTCHSNHPGENIHTAGKKNIFTVQKHTDLKKLTGWWFEPLWKIWKSIGMIIPNKNGKIKLMFQTTNQLRRDGLGLKSMGIIHTEMTLEGRRSLGEQISVSEGQHKWVTC